MEDDWIFDSLIGFLRGPVWNVPILTYIEHKSLGNCLIYNPGLLGLKLLSSISTVETFKFLEIIVSFFKLYHMDYIEELI